jgi:prevent-host-death family protein
VKAKLSEYVARVKRGEEVLITERGKPVARMVPVAPGTAEDARMRALVRKGALRPGKGKLRRLLAELPACALPEGRALKVLREEREARA